MILSHTNTKTTPVFGNVPQELAERDQWVLWQAIERDDRSTKMPVTVCREAASTTDPTCWAAFESVVMTYDETHDSGIGFVFSADDDLLGVDLDGCRNSTDGTIAPWAESIVNEFSTYTEISPSGTGVKLFCRSATQLPKGRKTNIDAKPTSTKTPGIEVYSQRRYFAVTGRVLDDHNVVTDCTRQVDRLLQEYWPTQSEPSTPQQDWRSDDAVVARARKYVAKMEPAVSGQRGHDATFSVACRLVQGFGLTKPQAIAVMMEWNQTCQPPWTETELTHKVDDASKQPGERGYLRHAKPERWDEVASLHMKDDSEVPWISCALVTVV